MAKSLDELRKVRLFLLVTLALEEMPERTRSVYERSLREIEQEIAEIETSGEKAFLKTALC